MKRLTFIMLLLMSALTTGMLASCGNADADEIDGFVIKNGVLRKYNGEGGDVVIPDGVTIIRDSAFEGCESLTSVIIPDTVTSIFREAFMNCKNLRSVKIGSGVTIIWDSAFFGCSSLQSIIIPDSVTTIETFAFHGCAFTSVTIPSSVTSIASRAFDNEGTLRYVYFEDAESTWIATNEDDSEKLSAADLAKILKSPSNYYWDYRYYTFKKVIE